MAVLLLWKRLQRAKCDTEMISQHETVRQITALGTRKWFQKCDLFWLITDFVIRPCEMEWSCASADLWSHGRLWCRWIPRCRTVLSPPVLPSDLQQHTAADKWATERWQKTERREEATCEMYVCKSIYCFTDSPTSQLNILFLYIYHV